MMHEGRAIRACALVAIVWFAGCGEKPLDHRTFASRGGAASQNQQPGPANGSGAGDAQAPKEGSSTNETEKKVTAPPEPQWLLPKNALTAEDLGVVVNDRDPQSVAVAAYYAEKRKIPAKNLIHVSFNPDTDGLMPDEFAGVKRDVDAKAGAGIQAFALTWKRPFRVGCMAVTSAFALGYDAKWCNTTGQVCSYTATVATFNKDVTQAFTDFTVRPTMALAAESVALAKALIDRGVAADGTAPKGTAYLVGTTDGARSVRASDFAGLARVWPKAGDVAMTYQDNTAGALGGEGNYISGKKDVLSYFTGLTAVPDLGTLTFLPGAPADHLTSYGGIIAGDSGQMSILRFLEAGATASYGTVVEPCNFTGKFPSPSAFWPRYFRGKTLLEAYWASVLQPGEGLFVGEPLANPWGKAETKFAAGTLSVSLTWLDPGQTYVVEASDKADGPFTPVQADIKGSVGTRTTVTVKDATRAFYRLRRADPAAAAR